ncbi:pilus assembly protein Flp/PilA [Bradyrhizobium sp. JR1.5]|uniref:Flp family type IVb pilin n=1 Tax=unclassified Bradyrhizobium TaxID=2631580 RepID=UPI0033970E45
MQHCRKLPRGRTISADHRLIAAGIALAIIAVVNGLGSKLDSRFGAISASLR